MKHITNMKHITHMKHLKIIRTLLIIGITTIFCLWVCGCSPVNYDYLYKVKPQATATTTNSK